MLAGQLASTEVYSEQLGITIPAGTRMALDDGYVIYETTKPVTFRAPWYDALVRWWCRLRGRRRIYRAKVPVRAVF